MRDPFTFIIRYTSGALSSYVLHAEEELEQQQKQQEDDDSFSSTVATEESKRSAVPLSSCQLSRLVFVPQGQRRRRGVRFDENANIWYDNTTICYEECADLWYGAHDYAHFKTTTYYLAREARLLEAKQAKVQGRNPVPRPHNDPHHDTLAYAYARCCQEFCSEAPDRGLTSTEEEEILAKRLNISVSLNGLERCGSRSIVNDRNERRRTIVEAALQVQEDPVVSTVTWLFSPWEKAELIRETCEAVSLPSRLFARQVALAHARASGDLDLPLGSDRC